jgi:hypothetical protein
MSLTGKWRIAGPKASKTGKNTPFLALFDQFSML